MTLHCTITALYYTTVHYTTPHFTILHYTALRKLQLQLQLHYATLHYATLHHTTPHYTRLTTLQHATLQHTTLHYITLHYLITPHHNYNCKCTTLSTLLYNCNYSYSCTTPHYIPQLWVRWPLQPLEPLQKTQLQPPFGPSVGSLCHPCITTTHLSYSVLSLKLPPPPCAVLLV